MSLKTWTIQLLRKWSISPRKKLSQTFMVSEKYLHKIARHAELKPGLVVLEIGSGLGALTRVLASRGCYVVAVEVDKRLVEVSKQVLSRWHNIDLVWADFLKTKWLHFDRIVSNIPYHIASPILFKIVECMNFELAVVTLQKELAIRLAAKPGTSNYGRLTVMVNYYAEVELKEVVPRQAFYPVPEVDSMIVKLRRKKKRELSNTEERVFKELVKHAFTQRRKKLKTPLSKFLTERLGKDIYVEFLEYLGGSRLDLLEKRVYTLALSEFCELARLITSFLKMKGYSLDALAV